MTRETEGEAFILTQAVFWGLFPVVTILSFTDMSPMVSAGLSTLLASVFFGGVISGQRRWHELLRRDAWKPIAFATLFIGVIYYGLVFLGAAQTSANNVSIILLTESLFTIVVLRLLGAERMSGRSFIGALVMVCGALIVLFPGRFDVQPGDLFLIGANIVAPMGNIFAQRARMIVSSSTLMFVRSIVSGVSLLAIGLYLAPADMNAETLTRSLPFLVVNGVVLLGFSKLLWIEGIHRLSLSKATSLSAITPFFTMCFSWLLLDEVPTPWQVGGAIPLAIGLVILTRRGLYASNERYATGM